jgi:hypothetical protein
MDIIHIPTKINVAKIRENKDEVAELEELGGR